MSWSQDGNVVDQQFGIAQGPSPNLPPPISHPHRAPTAHLPQPVNTFGAYSSLPLSAPRHHHAHAGTHQGESRYNGDMGLHLHNGHGSSSRDNLSSNNGDNTQITGNLFPQHLGTTPQSGQRSNFHDPGHDASAHRNRPDPPFPCYAGNEDRTSFPVPTRSQAPSARRPRREGPSESEWERNKPHIKQLYIKEDLALSKVVGLMKERHKFTATEKMYKNRFKMWQWSKNLAQKKALWMFSKVKERKPAATAFSWRNQEWPDDRIIQMCERFPGPNAGPELLIAADGDTATPSEMKDIQYWTPRPVAQTPHPSTPHIVTVQESPSGSTSSSQKFFLDKPPVNLEMARATVAELWGLLDSASRAASKGRLDEAHADFRDAVAGLRHLLSPTHEETLKAGYLYASFCATSGNMDKADHILSWMADNHKAKWGATHERSYLHYGRTIELLRSWGRKEVAETLVYKILEELDEQQEPRLNLSELSHSRSPQPAGFIHDLDNAFPETDDPDAIRRQLNALDLAVMTNIQGFDDVLRTIIRHCDEGNAEDLRLSLQACRARCTLAKQGVAIGLTDEAVRVLKSAKPSLDRLLRIQKDALPHSTIEIARRVALGFFDANDESASKNVLNRVISTLEAQLWLPDREGGDV